MKRIFQISLRSVCTLLSVAVLSVFLTYPLYGKIVSKYPDIEIHTSNTLLYIDKNQNTVSRIDDKLRKKQLILQRTDRSHIVEYFSLYDEIAQLIISKNILLSMSGKTDSINIDGTCDFALKYGEIEFIKTEYYKTPFCDEVAKTLQSIAKLYEQCYPSMSGKYLKSILQIKENIYGKESAETAKILDMLADYYRIYMRDFKNSILLYKKAKKIREKIYGIKDLRVTENCGRLSTSLYYHGDKNNQAEMLLLGCINIRKKASFKRLPRILCKQLL